jgi:hypothetical protein
VGNPCNVVLVDNLPGESYVDSFERQAGPIEDLIGKEIILVSWCGNLLSGTLVGWGIDGPILTNTKQDGAWVDPCHPGAKWSVRGK